MNRIKHKDGNSTTNTFYFQIRESPAPINIPTPTPAPDRGGPVTILVETIFHFIIYLGFQNGL